MIRIFPIGYTSKSPLFGFQKVLMVGHRGIYRRTKHKAKIIAAVLQK